MAMDPLRKPSWIAQRLPKGANFSKNNLTQSVDDAITEALSDNDGQTNDHMLALADLLDVLASDVKFDSENYSGNGSYSYSKSTLVDRANYWRTKAKQISGGSGWSGVQMKFEETTADQDSD